MNKVRTTSSLETAVLLKKCDALLRLIAVMATFMIWYALAFAAVTVYLSRPGALSQAWQVLTTAGLAPLPAIALTWRLVEWAMVQWWNHFVKTHVEAA